MIKLGDEFSKYLKILTGGSQFDCSTRFLLKRRKSCNKKSIPSSNRWCSFRIRYRKNFILWFYGKRNFSDAPIVNVGSQKIQNEEHITNFMLISDSVSIKNQFTVSDKISCIDNLKMAIKELQLQNIKCTLSESRLVQISSEIRQGIYQFAALSSYRIPLKHVALSKGRIIEYLKTSSLKEKKQFYDDMKKKKRHTKIVTEFRQVYQETLETKIVAKAIKLILVDIIKIKYPYSCNMFSFHDEADFIDMIHFIQKKSNKCNPTFNIKAYLKDFFLSIKKKYIIRGFAGFVDPKDNKFYHLIKSYLRCGYTVKILKKSDKIGAITIKTIVKNKSKNCVYQGTILAPLFSDVIHKLILSDINKEIKEHCTFGSNKVSAICNIIGSTKLIKKRKPTSFLRRTWLITHNDSILVYGHLSKKEREWLWLCLEKIFFRYEFVFDMNKTFISNNPYRPLSFLGFEILKSCKYVDTENKQGVPCLIIRPSTKKILDLLLEKNIIMYRGGVIPFNIKNSKKHFKKIKKKKVSPLTISNFSKKYKVLHYTPYVREEPQKIIDYYNNLMYRIEFYYKYCDNYYKLRYIYIILRYSCLKTLAKKYRCGTIKKLFILFGYNLERLVHNCLLSPAIKKSILKKSLLDKMVWSSVAYPSFANIFNNSGAILKLRCALCLSMENLEWHDSQSIYRLKTKIKIQKYNYYNFKYTSVESYRFFDIIHLTLNKKQITVCLKCYSEIYDGTLHSSLYTKEIRRLKESL